MIVFDASRSVTSAKVATSGQWQRGVGGPVSVRLYTLRVRAVSNDPRTVLLGWAGGACDNLTRVEIRSDGRHWHFYQGPWIGCDAVGVGWFEAVTFDHAIDVGRLVIESTWWPTSTDGSGTAIQMARVRSESSRTPEVTDVLDGTYEALYWGDLAKRYPNLSAENLNLLRQTPSWLVSLSGRYRTCDSGGTHCSRRDGTEDFVFDVENADFLASRRR